VTHHTPPEGALEGTRVVDLTANVSGPLATMMLADQGADVVKVEPPEGDILRRVGSGRGGMSAFFANLNRGKRSIVVDLSSPEGVRLVRRLAKDADVFVQNFRRGVVERLGLGARGLRASNPRLVHASITGFGDAGPYADQPVYDHVVQALAGVAALQADRDGVPALVRQALVDKVTGLTLAQAVTGALLRRVRTGEGCELRVSMLDAVLAFQWPDGMMNQTCLQPDDVKPSIADSFRVTPTADGHLVFAVLTQRQWAGLTQFATGDDAEPPPSPGAVMRAARRRVGAMPTDEAAAALAAHGVPASPVVALDDVAYHPQVVAVGAVLDSEHPTLGRIRQPAPPVGAVAAPGPGRPAPSLGEHTAEVLGELGCSPAEIDELRARGVVR
jgi:crotonobetainyl-CoA:carnitine CoA-transferase CaiB-like acyl-CoA transferase